MHRALTAIDLVGPVATIVVTITHPLLSNAAPVAAAVLLCGIAIWGKWRLGRMERTSMMNTQNDLAHSSAEDSLFQLLQYLWRLLCAGSGTVTTSPPI